MTTRLKQVAEIGKCEILKTSTFIWSKSSDFQQKQFAFVTAFELPLKHISAKQTELGTFRKIQLQRKIICKNLYCALFDGFDFILKY